MIGPGKRGSRRAHEWESGSGPSRLADSFPAQPKRRSAAGIKRSAKPSRRRPLGKTQRHGRLGMWSNDRQTPLS